MKKKGPKRKKGKKGKDPLPGGYKGDAAKTA
jgi:hypothetical protein